MALDVREGISWFNPEVVRKVRNGLSTKFWDDPWVGSVPLRVAFPRLYSLSTQNGACVCDLWLVLDGVGERRFSWRHQLFVWEVGLVNNLLGCIGVFVEVGGSDAWEWKLKDGGYFSVKYCYSLLERMEAVDMEIDGGEKRVLNYIWMSPAPLKVLAFSWTLLQDRISTRANLALRRVLDGGEDGCFCVLCGRRVETEIHLFLHCEVVSKVWVMVFNWVNVNFITPPSLGTHLDHWFNEVGSKKLRKGLLMIWHATIWSIWLERNDRIFKGVNKNVVEIFDALRLYLGVGVLIDSRVNRSLPPVI